MARQVTAVVRVLGGFTLEVTGVVTGHWVGPASDIDITEITTLDGKPAKFIEKRMTPTDWSKCRQAVADAA